MLFNMKKNIMIIICLFLFTGCDVTYNITIDDKIEELTNFYFEESDYSYDTYYADYGDDNISNFSNIDEFTQSIYNEDYLAFDGDFNNQELYNVQKINDGISLNYSYKYDNFDKSSIFNYCGDIVEYQTGNDTVSISVNDFYNCFMSEYDPALDDLTINIKTNLKVLENNADSVNGNVYTWNINKDNSSVKRVYIKVKKGSDYFSMFIDIGIVIGFVIVIVLLVFLVKKKIAKNNEI